jgi:hypothetical protein
LCDHFDEAILLEADSALGDGLHEKDNELARDPVTELGLSGKFEYRGAKDELTTLPSAAKSKRAQRKRTSIGKEPIDLYVEDAPNAQTTCHVIPTISSLLPKCDNHCPTKKAFPYGYICAVRL